MSFSPGPLTSAATSTRANAKPLTIPALQEWQGATGTYRFSTTTRIVRDSAHATSLAGTSATFADDLRALSGVRPTETTGTVQSLQPGDIFLALTSADGRLGHEGYTLTVTDRATVTAPTKAGAFNGTRTLLQLIHQNPALPRGTARDWPDASERGLMVDVGRKYFTPRWLAAHVKELAYLKMNQLHLHLSENEGFRIESTRHPEFVSHQHLTKREVTELVALAARYNITIVPEIDMPSHMGAILAKHPDLQLTDAGRRVQRGRIDLSNPRSYALMRDILDEYLPLFPGPYFHIGTDEYGTIDGVEFPQLLQYARTRYGPKANNRDAFFGFINWANAIVRASGKTTRIWNDGLRGDGSAVAVDRSVIVEYWYKKGTVTPQQHVDQGHLISNESWTPTYYVLGGSKPDTTWGYERWNRHLFQGGQTLTAASRGRNLGSKIHVWCDQPQEQTEAEVAVGLNNPLRMLAQQTWGSPKLTPTWNEYQPLIARVGHNPSWQSI
ncbi:family 20 glycosylhydrolase [Streptomyces sioyaensis]|uniref:family 20 glycosylhydrolase n=1 Tax=Streptomyces sioyaensis TaxID=67364 RepID=UPI003408FE57